MLSKPWPLVSCWIYYAKSPPTVHQVLSIMFEGNAEFIDQQEGDLFTCLHWLLKDNDIEGSIEWVLELEVLAVVYSMCVCVCVWRRGWGPSNLHFAKTLTQLKSCMVWYRNMTTMSQSDVQLSMPGKYELLISCSVLGHHMVVCPPSYISASLTKTLLWQLWGVLILLGSWTFHPCLSFLDPSPVPTRVLGGGLTHAVFATSENG